MKYYSGVGSRETPKEILDIMEKFATKISWTHKFILRTGGADGADSSFWKGACQAYSEVQAEIYIPWSGFNGFTPEREQVIEPSSLLNWPIAQKIASTIHPVWDVLTEGAKILHTRNIYQVLGKDLATPSRFLICYAKPQGNSVSGGTRTAWECARMNNIPCFNLYDSATMERIKKFLGE